MRFEPVNPPLIVLRDERAVTNPGSQLERLVIRTFNDNLQKDNAPADLTVSDRFIAPPSTSVEVGERLGMFDDENGIINSQAMYELIGKRDEDKLNLVQVEVAGQKQTFPLVTEERIKELPYLPDVLARGAALRDLPGTRNSSIASVKPGTDPDTTIEYESLDDANPRPGSATLVSFGEKKDWQKLVPFRLALAEGDNAPNWDSQARVLTVFLPKASHYTIPLSSYLLADDLKLMGIWSWLREYIDKTTLQQPEVPVMDRRFDEEKIAHLLQRTVEGGHWMMTPPRLISLVHAVQQPIGAPEFSAISLQHQPYGTANRWGYLEEKVDPDPNVLQTAPENYPTAESELTAITAWRKPNSEQAYLLGGLYIHAKSTGKIDLFAEWSDPVDDKTKLREKNQKYRTQNSAHVDEIPIPSDQEGYIITGQDTTNQNSSNERKLAYYDADHDLLCFVRHGDELGNLKSGITISEDAAPRHHLNDTKYHRVTYTARATSRFQEYFPQDNGLDFTRESQSTIVDVPASARPDLPLADYVIPTFGWQRQVQTNLKRSVRFGGGLRVFLDRPWFSSGDGELLGLALYYSENNSISDMESREAWKPFITQWGADPIWSSPSLANVPNFYSFPTAVATEENLSLPGNAPGRVSVAGFPVEFDYKRQKWFADLTVDIRSFTYTPFIRLALVRYQPFALPDAKLSPVILADYAQLAPERSAVITADPYHPRRLRVTVSGPAPSSHVAIVDNKPITAHTEVDIKVQRRVSTIQSDLAWQDVPDTIAKVKPQPNADLTGLIRWTGIINFSALPKPDQFRLVIREYEYLPNIFTIETKQSRERNVQHRQQKRLIYAEIVEIDATLISDPSFETHTILED